MLTKHVAKRYIYFTCEKESPRNTLTPTLIKPKSNMELPPLPINITHNQEGNGAILHINCQSDATTTRWMDNREEASIGAQKVWLGKLGCLLKLHGSIEYAFNDPWAYSISNFPQGYKLFSVERETQGDDLSRKDHYLCGGKYKYRSPQEFYPHLHWLLDNARGVKHPCICQYCDQGRSQEEINQIFPLPPHKKSSQGPKGPKNKKTKKHQGPKGVTTRRGMILNRNSITTGPVTALRDGWQEDKFIGYKTSHPFR
ncbi:hypothetical protein BJ322DRAFT_600464 [Thelephora terrestris]|uniref:Cryptic loci regulator 2 N-terminal domain-containing protein n=1 Tax=Thelephora terrestris TaxID=56493 RepID=A0A9P6L949_9AGAM|nr:hypothetical protein BJ322DRAFT_600464 [Thelephora terrestris]